MHKLHPYHEMLFNAVIKERKEFPDLNSIAEFFAQNGLNKEEFLKNANSFSTKVKNDRAFKTWQAYEIDGTPANAVNGKYITAPHMVGTREGAIQVMNYLIVKRTSRQEISGFGSKEVRLHFSFFLQLLGAAAFAARDKLCMIISIKNIYSPGTECPAAE